MWEVEAECQARLIAASKHGAFDPGDLPDAVVRGVFTDALWLMQGRIDQLWRSAESGSVDVGKKIRVAINDDATVNAFAYLDEEYPIISINAGACVRIRQLMHHAVHNLEVFPVRTGENRFPSEPVAESLALSPPGVLTEPIRRAFDPGDVGFSLAGPLAPSEERQALARALTIAALDFLTMHEVAHVWRSHSRFSGGVSNNVVMEVERRDGRDGDGVNYALLQVLELDADITAGQESARQFAGGREVLPIWQPWATDKAEVVRAWLIGLALTFFLFDGYSRTRPDLTRTHPLPRVRLVFLLNVVAEEVAGWGLMDNAHEVMRFAVEAHSHAVKIWSDLGLPVESASLGTAEQVRYEYQEYIGLMEQYGLRSS